jgi:hypothetical protein
MSPEAGLGILAGSLAMIAVLVVIGIIVFIIPYWKIFGKAGYSPAMSLLLFVPIANIIVIYWLAFSDWPALRRQAGMAQPTPPYGTPPQFVPPPPQFAPPPPPATFRCPLCGTQLDPSQRFCTHCGGAVQR